MSCGVKECLFPFGQKLKRLEQECRTPKDVFVLGAYASAVHARWVGPNGKIISAALAVASEPRIFWDGHKEEAECIIASINIPEGMGHLAPAACRLNGPSGRALDRCILEPLGFERSGAWLCDLIPEARLNKYQQNRIEKSYNPFINKYGLNEVSVPCLKGNYSSEIKRYEEKYGENRCEKITQELKQSKATYLILLGDMPIKHYLKLVADIDFKNLDEFSCKHGYGNSYTVCIDGMKIKVRSLAHPRQISGLGAHNSKWSTVHNEFMQRFADRSQQGI